MTGIAIIFEKNSALSSEARKRGNELYWQKSHNENQHKQILGQYSKSIAFAKTSDELALGYANRSTLLLHLNENARCLVDVDRALKITNSAELKSELEIRKAKCMDAMGSDSSHATSTSEKKFNPPIFAPSADIPSASEAVTVKYNEEFGRHMVATRDIEPAEVIIAERGYVYFPMIERRHLVCSHCLSFACNGIPCDRCAFAMYCSETCKEDAWREYHDVECTLFLTVPRPLFEEEVWLFSLLKASRLLIKAVKSEGFDAVIAELCRANSGNYKGIDGLMVEGKLRSDTFRSCINLLSSQYTDDIKFYESTIPHLAETLYRRTSLFNLEESNIDESETIVSQLKVLLKKLVGIIQLNSFMYQTIACECENQLECRCDIRHGSVLAPFGSLINHSCEPNVKRMCLPSGKILMFTIAPVKKGEQLYGSYGTVYPNERDYRQQLLKTYFHFTCKCKACEEDWPTDRDLVEITMDETMAYMKMKEEFSRYFPSVTKTPVTMESKDWQFNEETLKHAVKLSELTHKHFNNAMLASFHNDNCGKYIYTAFHKFYGEKFGMPENCP